MPTTSLPENVPAAEREPAMAPQRQNSRPLVNTFDVFDTLIARRCIQPVRIFEIVAVRAGLPSFVEARVKAEAVVSQQPYDLGKIYEELAKRLGLTEEEAIRLRSIEIHVERESAIPVAENMAAVVDGDLLISDMYLGADIIQSLLEAANFNKHAALVVTSDGKHSGHIWPKILEIVEIKEHVGDNLHSDIAVPARLGIRNRHTAVTSPNMVEKTLLDIGLRDLAEICREARLTTWDSDADLRALQIVQASYNFPLLIVASILLTRLAQRLGSCSILFSSRDCNLWISVFRFVATRMGLDVMAGYFYTSRLTRINPSRDYLAYARHIIDSKTLIVDICGTGWSLANLCESLYLQDQPVAFLQKLPPIAEYESIVHTPLTCDVHELLTGVEGCNSTAVEMCNYARHGMVKDVQHVAGAPMPLFADDGRSFRTFASIAAQGTAFETAVCILKKQGLRETLTLSDESLSILGGALYKGLSRNQTLYSTFFAEHDTENTAALRAMLSMRGA